jgi:hypothetical protein
LRRLHEVGSVGLLEIPALAELAGTSLTCSRHKGMRTANVYGFVVYALLAGVTYWGSIPWSSGWVAMLLAIIALDCLWDAIRE